MPIVLRLTKGSELTFAELDGNFTDLDNRVDTIEAHDLDARVTKLEAAGTPIYFDSDDVMVMLDSIFSGIGDSGNFLATNDSIGLASFEVDHFIVDSNARVSIRLAGNIKIDSAGIASFDSSDFLVDSFGHVNINPLSAAGRVAGITPIDSTGLASFDSSSFIVDSHGHVNLNPLSAAGRVAGITPIDSTGVASFDASTFLVDSVGHVNITLAGLSRIDSTGVASFDSADFNVDSHGHVTLIGGGGTPVAFAGGGSLIMPANFTVAISGGAGWSTQTYDPWEASRFPFIAGARYIGNFRFYHTWFGGAGQPTGTGFTGINSTGGTGIQNITNDAYTNVTLEDATIHAGGGDYIEFTAGTNCRLKVVAYNYWNYAHTLGVQNTGSTARDNNLFYYMRIG